MRNAFQLFLLLLGTMLLSNCAQTAPPVPPSLELPKPVTDLRVSRKGDKVFLRWTVPTQTLDGESIRALGPAHICRSFDSNMNQCEFSGREVKSNLPIMEKGKATPKVEASYTDTLSPDLQQDSTKVLTYAVSVLNQSGRGAGISNKVQVSAAPTLPPPADLNAQVTADGVVLQWTATSLPTDGLHRFYRTYRRLEESNNDVVGGELPLESPTTQFVDHGFEWGKTYYYHVNVVTEVAAGIHPCGSQQQPLGDCATVYQVEGDDSPIIKIFADDIFPPAIPAGLQAVFSGVGQKPFIDLIWTPGTENDLTGYNVYRREEGGQPIRINTEFVKTQAYRDTSVQPGKKYFYSVSAVDIRGNESGRSEEASEQVP
jgi:hypothetical protein